MTEIASSIAPGAIVNGTRDEDGLRQGCFRFHNEAGDLVATAHYRDDLLHGQVVTFAGGQRVAELAYVNGLPDGSFRKRVGSGVYACEGVAWEEGAYSKGVPSGVLRLESDDGRTLAWRNFGEGPLDDETLKSCLREGGLTCPEDWNHRACALIAKRRVAEALCCLARAVGCGADPESLRLAISRVAAPVTPDEAFLRADSVSSSMSARVVLGALLRGADPARIFRRIALLARGDASALFLHASVALREWPLSPILARALREVRSGDPADVVDDVRRLLLSHEAEARVLRILAVRRVRAMKEGTEPGLARESTESPTMRRHA